MTDNKAAPITDENIFSAHEEIATAYNKLSMFDWKLYVEERKLCNSVMNINENNYSLAEAVVQFLEALDKIAKEGASQ